MDVDQIADQPNLVKTHFVLLTSPSAKGQARYRCLKCGHEFECCGKIRLIHHITGFSPDGSLSKNVKICSNPHQPLKEALIRQVNEGYPPKRRKNGGILNKRKKNSKQRKVTLSERLELQNAEKPAKESKFVDSSERFRSYSKDRLVTILNFLQTICPQHLQLAESLENMQNISAEMISKENLVLLSSMALANAPFNPPVLGDNLLFGNSLNPFYTAVSINAALDVVQTSGSLKIDSQETDTAHSLATV